MKILNLTFYFFLCVVLITTHTISLNAQEKSRSADNLKIQIDFQSAQAIIDLMQQKRVSDDELNRVAELKGNQQLVKKVTYHDPKATTETFKKTLRQVIENQKLSEDPFEWQSVKKNLPEISALINQIEKTKTVFLSNIENLIQPYTPNDLTGSVTAVFWSAAVRSVLL